MFGFITQLLGGGGIAAIERILGQIQRQRLEMKTMELEGDKLAHEEEILRLEKLADILIAEQGNRLTAWIRPSFAFVVLVYFGKVVIWDNVLGLGTTPNLGGFADYTATAVIGAYFLTRPFEKVFNRK